jgi:hypothetical protein
MQGVVFLLRLIKTKYKQFKQLKIMELIIMIVVVFLLMCSPWFIIPIAIFGAIVALGQSQYK